MINKSVVRGMGIPNYSNALGSTSMIIYLYLKTHNKTGLKYLGKTKENPHKYLGSGLYWSRHIKTHGNDITTEILKECSTNEEVKHWGEYYSDLWDIVNSDEFANLKTESGDGGPVGPDGAKKISEKIRKIRTNPEWRATIGEDAFKKMMKTRNSSEWQTTVGAAASKKHSDTLNDPTWYSTVGVEKAKKVSVKAKQRKNDPDWRATKGVEAREKEIETKTSQEWKDTVGAGMKQAMVEKRNSEEYKSKHYKTCPYCNKTMDPGNYAQRHGDKCKMKGVV
jgi:hypothetical protein